MLPWAGETHYPNHRTHRRWRNDIQPAVSYGALFSPDVSGCFWILQYRTRRHVCRLRYHRDGRVFSRRCDCRSILRSKIADAFYGFDGARRVLHGHHSYRDLNGTALRILGSYYHSFVGPPYLRPRATGAEICRKARHSVFSTEVVGSSPPLSPFLQLPSWQAYCRLTLHLRRAQSKDQRFAVSFFCIRLPRRWSA